MTTGAALAVQVLVLAGRVGGDRNPQGPEPTSISPGLIGFLATFGLVVAAILLFVSMTRHLRKVDHRARREAAAGGDLGPPVRRGEEERAEESSLEDSGSDDDGEDAPRHG